MVASILDEDVGVEGDAGHQADEVEYCIMNTKIKAGVAALLAAGSMTAAAAPANAYGYWGGHGYYGGRGYGAGALVGAGIAGLAVGAALSGPHYGYGYGPRYAYGPRPLLRLRRLRGAPQRLGPLLWRLRGSPGAGTLLTLTA